MNSKLAKHKQLLSMLNTMPPRSSSSPDSPPEAAEARSFDKPSSPQLLNQVYQFHKSIIQNINAGLIAIDMSGGITFANKSAAHLLGFSVLDLHGSSINTLFREESEANKFLEICRRPGQRINDWESAFVGGDGSEVIVGIDAAVFEDVNNDFRGVVLILRDLTDIYHFRGQIERMERLALLGELAAGIAHEVRNPLAGIKAATQVLEETLDGTDLQQELTRRIVREVDKANRLLVEFFKFARPAKPKAAFHRLETIIDSVYLLLAPRLKQMRIQFEESFRTQQEKIFVDETQIEQVVLNLFLNALEAMPERGTLAVKTYEKQLPLVGDEQRYSGGGEERLYGIVEISDNGPGITEKVLKKIFNPFFTTKPDGLGLGLSICSRLVQENGGKIDVLSKPGEGTTFILALPAFAHHEKA